MDDIWEINLSLKGMREGQICPIMLQICPALYKLMHNWKETHEVSLLIYP